MKVISIINESNLVSKKEFSDMVDAVATQVKRDFCPAWGLSKIKVVKRSKNPKGWVITIKNEPDPGDEGALGYHTMTNDMEWGVIFVKPVLDAGGVINIDKNDITTPTVASVLSHEVLELIADPYVNAWIEGPRRKEGYLYALEVCDPVESDQYSIGNVAVSNFILPEWGNEETNITADYDFMKKLTAPFTMSKGGYMVVRGVGNSGTEVFAKKRPKWRKKAKTLKIGSRNSKRLNGE
jgi:hypothetical protein